MVLPTESMLQFVIVLLVIMKTLTVPVKNVTTVVPPVLLITDVLDVVISKEEKLSMVLMQLLNNAHVSVDTMITVLLIVVPVTINVSLVLDLLKTV